MNILYIEDDQGLAALGKRKLEQHGYRVKTCGTLVEARLALQEGAIGCVLTDYCLPDGNGLELLTEDKKVHSDCPWIMITGVGNESLAVHAMKLGASDYLVKDLEGTYLDLLPSTIQRALAINTMAHEKTLAEQALIKARDQWQSLFNASIDLMVVCSENRRCLEISEKALARYGMCADDFIGRDIFEVFDLTQHASRLDRLKQGENEEIELNVRFGGQLVPMSIRARLLSDDRVLMSLRDIRERYALRDAQQTVHRVVEERDRLAASSQYLSQELKRATTRKMAGNHSNFLAALKTIEQAAQVDASVLVTGETGTGKELVADLLHELSPRAEHSLIKVNCAALPTELVESELFGHVKGSFTGAFQNKVGRFEAAHRGTLVLDEIGEFPLTLQAKLLRALQSGDFQRIGSNETRQVDVRVVALTNRDLRAMIEKGQFREDLYYRLNVIPVHLPPLRDRGDDIPLLFGSFVDELRLKRTTSTAPIPQFVHEHILNYDWPGNIRELRNYVERGLAINNWVLPQQVNTQQEEATYDDTPIISLAQNEKQHILKALAACDGTISGKKGAAALLDINSNTLRARMEKRGIKAGNRYG